MKHLFLAVIFALGAFAYAVPNTNNESDQNCSGDAKQYLKKQIRVPEQDIKFFDGALVGDGVDAIEIDMYAVKGKPGFYKVEVDGEDCTLLSNIDYVNN